MDKTTLAFLLAALASAPSVTVAAPAGGRVPDPAACRGIAVDATRAKARREGEEVRVRQILTSTDFGKETRDSVLIEVSFSNGDSDDRYLTAYNALTCVVNWVQFFSTDR